MRKLTASHHLLPLSFLILYFSSAKKHRSTHGKSLDRGKNFKRMHHFPAYSNDVEVLNEHGAILLTFHTTDVERSIGRNKVMEVVWCALSFAVLSYTIKQILRRMNALTGITTKWWRWNRRIKTLHSCVTRMGVSAGCAMVPMAQTNSISWSFRELIWSISDNAKM